MPTDLILPERPTNTEISPLAELAGRASELIDQSKAKNTVRAYRSDWMHFTAWCKAHGQSSLPATAETVALYITDLADAHKTATITRRILAVSQAHQIASLDTPRGSAKVRLGMAGIRRSKGTAQSAKTPVLVDDLRRMLAELPDNLLGVRDRVLLLIGFLWGLQAIRTRRSGRRRRYGHTRRVGGDDPSQQNRSGRRRPENRDSVCFPFGNVPGPVFSGLVGKERHHRRAVVPPDKPLRKNVIYPAICRCRRRHREAICRRRGPGRHGVRRSQFAIWIGDICGRCWRFGTVDHEPDGASVGQ